MLINDGQKPNTVRHTKYKLHELAAHVDLFNPEAVKNYVATAISEKTNQPFSAETKNKFLYAADKFYENQRIRWSKPYHKVEEKIPLIPTTVNVELIITNASQKYATIFTILAETGAEGKELEKTRRDQIDTEQGIINITGCKGHGSGSYKLKNKTAEMLRIYLSKHPERNPFPKSEVMGQVWRDTRERTAKKLCKPELNNIPLKNLRNYSGAEYRPEQFPGLVFRLKRPKTATLIFSSGKMVCTGARSGKESRSAIMQVVKELKKVGIIILSKPDFKVVNIVASASLGGNVDLEKTVVALRHTMYEPEQFPGLIYRMDEPKVVILIFASGNLVITGAKKKQDVYDAVHKLHENLEEQNLIFYE